MSVGGLWMGTSTWVFPVLGSKQLLLLLLKPQRRSRRWGKDIDIFTTDGSRHIANWTEALEETNNETGLLWRASAFSRQSGGAISTCKGVFNGGWNIFLCCLVRHAGGGDQKIPSIRCGKRVYGHASMVLYLFTGVVHKQAGSQLWLLILSDQGLVYEEEEGERCGIVLREHSGSGSVTVSWWMNLENRGLVKDQEMRIWQTISGFIGSREGDHLSTSLYHIFSADLFPTCIDLLDREIPRLVGTVNYVGFTSLPPRTQRKGIDYPFRWSFQWVAQTRTTNHFDWLTGVNFFCLNGRIIMVKEEFVFSGRGEWEQEEFCVTVKRCD